MSLPPDLAHAAAMVQGADPDRFAATMAAPVAARARLWPLYAFNLEVARAAYASAEPIVSEMRLQWWIDQLDRLGQGGRADGEVAGALAPLVATVPGLGAALATIPEARRWDCWSEPFADAPGLWDYLDETGGSLMWAAALSLGAGPGHEAAVRDFAKGAGLANWLVAVPALSDRGRSPLPDADPAAIAALAGEGLAHLTRARKTGLPRALAPALWPGFAAGAILRQARARPGHVVAGLTGISALRRTMALAWRSVSGRF